MYHLQINLKPHKLFDIVEKSQKHLLIEKSEEPTKFILVGISGIFVNYFVLYIISVTVVQQGFISRKSTSNTCE